MLLTIHNQHLKKVAFIDNNKQKTLNYYDDTWTRQLETGSSTFEFTVFKRSVQSDMLGYKAYKTLHDKAFISFKYKQQTYVFNVMRVEEDEHTIKCYCENLNLELLNEYSNPYKAKEAMSFKQYCDILGLLNYSSLSIGINEVADFKRTLEWEGQDTKLARLLSLANKFDAEIEFETKLNPDSTLKSFKINVYRENDDEHQGVGRIRTDIRLEYKKNLKSIKRTVDKTGIFNAIRPTGKTEGDDPKEVTIGGMVDPIKEKNAKGILEFYQDGDVLYAPISRQMYPSAFAPENNDDQWIRKDLFVESDNQKVIRAAGLRALKKAAYPAVTYEIDGFLDVEIGDTIQIYDNGFSPALNIRARVSEQTISFTNPQNNKTTFANFKELENRLSSNLQARLEQLIEESRPYAIRLSASNGVVFKNNRGLSIITPTLLKGSKEISSVEWKWQLSNTSITTSNTYTVNAALVTDASKLTVIAFVNNKEVAKDYLTLVNVNDGIKGDKGDKGTFEGTVGRRNLLKGTKALSRYSPLSEYNGFKVARSVAGATGYRDTYSERMTIAATGTEYIGLFWARSSQNNYPIYCYFYNPGTTTTVTTSTGYTKDRAGDGFCELRIGTEWKLYWVKWSQTVTDSPKNIIFGRHGTWKGGIAGAWVEICAPALYEGHAVGDHVDAPEDTNDQIKQVEDQIPTNVSARNYILNSDISGSLTSGKNVDLTISPDFFSDVNTERSFTMSLEIEGKNLQALNGRRRFGLAFCFNFEDGGLWYPEVWQETDTDKKRISKTWNLPVGKNLKSIQYVKIMNSTGSSIGYARPKLEISRLVTAWSVAPEDIKSKADGKLTQEQLNALAEKTQIQDAELKAKASIQALNELEKAYTAFVKSNAEAAKKSETDLIEAGRRLELLTTQIGGLREMKTFIDTYMSSSNEGLIIGKSDASSTIKVSSDRISMFSAGKEVMYISQGVIHIDNGIFTASVQIGRFRTEQYPENLDMNIIRYVG